MSNTKKITRLTSAFYFTWGLILLMFMASCSRVEVDSTSENGIKVLPIHNIKSVTRVVATKEGSFLVLGVTPTGPALLVLNPDLSEKFYVVDTLSQYGQFKCAIQTSDGGYAVGGYSTNASWSADNSNPNAFVFKFDQNGIVTGGNAITNKSYENFLCVTENPIGQIVMAGELFNYGANSGRANVFITTWDLDFNGSSFKEYIHIHGGTSRVSDVTATPNGDLVFAGDRTIGVLADGFWQLEPFIVKYRQEATLIRSWDIRFFRHKREAIDSASRPISRIVTTTDGTLLATRHEEYAPNRAAVLLIKSDFNGNLIWEKKVHGLGEFEFINMIPYRDGFILTGGSKMLGVKGAQWQSHVIAIDGEGNVLWNQALGAKVNRTQHAMAAFDNGKNILIMANFTELGGLNQLVYYTLDYEGNLVNN